MIDQQFITLPYALEREPPPFEGNDIKYPEALVRFFMKWLVGGRLSKDQLPQMSSLQFSVATLFHSCAIARKCQRSLNGSLRKHSARIVKSDIKQRRNFWLI